DGGGVVVDIHRLGRHETAREGVIGWWADHQPELGDLGLLGRALGTGLAAIVFEFVEVRGPLLARQRYGRVWPKLGSFGHGERLYVRPRRGFGDGRWHIHAGRGPRPRVIDRTGAVVRASLHPPCRNRLAELDTIGFRCAIGNRC